MGTAILLDCAKLGLSLTPQTLPELPCGHVSRPAYWNLSPAQPALLHSAHASLQEREQAAGKDGQVKQEEYPLPRGSPAPQCAYTKAGQVSAKDPLGKGGPPGPLSSVPSLLGRTRVAEPAWVGLEATKPGLWRWPWSREPQGPFCKERGEPRKDAVGSGDGRTTMGEEGALAWSSSPTPLRAPWRGQGSPRLS